jgi:hypothetical protein
VIKVRNINAPVLDTWTPVVAHVFEDNPGTDGDFPSLSNYNELPVMSERAWVALRPLIGYCCEALPIIHPAGKPYFIVHVMETIDGLDANRSEVKHFTDGGIMRIVRYSFKPEMLQDKHIFKLPRESGGELVVDDDFRRAVEANGLKGLQFKELPMVQ